MLHSIWSAEVWSLREKRSTHEEFLPRETLQSAVRSSGTCTVHTQYHAELRRQSYECGAVVAAGLCRADHQIREKCRREVKRPAEGSSWVSGCIPSCAEQRKACLVGQFNSYPGAGGSSLNVGIQATLGKAELQKWSWSNPEWKSLPSELYPSRPKVAIFKG